MRYQVLMLNIPASLYQAVKHRFEGMDINFTAALTTQDAALLCARQQFHLIMLRLSNRAPYSEFLIAVRRVTYAPVIVLFDMYNTENLCCALQSGADFCAAIQWSVDLTADHILAQFRRYTAYGILEPRSEEDDNGAFQRGDIYIDPSRAVVRVKERSVRLRRREFLLLHYLMKNPNVALSAEKICNNAWGNEGCYPQGVSGPIAILRKAIEPDPAHPIYIKTKKTYGYLFTAHNSETCDICSDSVGLL